MADDLSVLGDLVIPVGGDISDFDDAVGKMPAAAQEAADAVQAAFENTSGVDAATAELNAMSSGLGELREPAAEASAAMDQAGEAATEAAGGADKMNEALERTSPASDQAQDALGRFTSQAHEAGDASEHGSEQLTEFLEKLLEIGGIALSIEALKEFVAESLGAYAATQKAEMSLTALTGSATVAAGAIEELKSLALSDALQFEPLVQGTQKMVAFGFSVQQAVETMKVAADAAAATGASIDHVSSIIDRMALSGNASARALAGLGLTTHDLAEAMGVAAEDVSAAFKDLDQTERLEAITEALEKYKGVAQEVAQGVAGQWQTLKTQFEFAMEGIGEALAPAATALMRFSSDALTNITPLVQGLWNLGTQAVSTAHDLGLTNDSLVALTAAFAINPVVGYTIAVVDLGNALLGLVHAEQALKQVEADQADAFNKMLIAVRQAGVDYSDLWKQ
jgi:predicted transcriptional regulator